MPKFAMPWFSCGNHQIPRLLLILKSVESYTLDGSELDFDNTQLAPDSIFVLELQWPLHPKQPHWSYSDLLGVR